MTNNLLHIGNIELVSLPNDAISNIPAKVDTGADNSSIWASNIHLKNGKLIFNFFAPGSAFYKEEPIVSTAYRTTTVRNSFGQKEFRYKIRLKVSIGDYTLTRWFTLADRSRNTYPILLGKNFLKNKFIVNVAQKFLVSKAVASNKVLVLGAQSASSAEFFKTVSQLNKLPLKYKCIGYDSLIYYIDNHQEIRVINISDHKTDLTSYTYTYFKTHAKNAEFASAAAEYLHFKGRPYIDKEPGNYVSYSKLSQYMKLACYGLPVPRTICANTKYLLASYPEIEKKLGLPFVLKEINSERGHNNYLIDNQRDFKNVLQMAPSEHVYLVQEYIENDGFYRIYVLGKEAELAIWRTRHEHPERLKVHLNKPSGGPNAKLIEISKLPGEAQDNATRAAHCLERQIAGVDMVQDIHSKKWYILEVNNAPQIRSGSFISEKADVIAKFFDKELSQ